jgi:hypothetical protein
MGLNKTKVTILLNDGSASWDVTANVTSVSTSVGKNRQLDEFRPGTAQITLTNFNREFDPLNTSSAFYGAVIPKASKVYVTFERPGVPTARFIFVGYIDDWSFDYSVTGEATATFSASEASALFARQFILGYATLPAELSGARVTRILADAGVSYQNIVPSVSASIDAGTQMLVADPTCAGQNVLDYLNNIAVSEQGAFFYDTNGALTFEDNSRSATNTINNANRLFTDDATANAYPYSSIDIGYTSELLYNKIKVTSFDETNYVSATSSSSQTTYGISDLNLTNIYYTNTTQLTNLALFLLKKYRTPEYRVSSLVVPFISFSDSLQDNLLAFAQINNFMKVKFRPNGIGTSIESYVRVVGIEHEISLDNHLVKYKLESLRNPSLVLDDVEFGKLDTYYLGL